MCGCHGWRHTLLVGRSSVSRARAGRPPPLSHGGADDGRALPPRARRGRTAPLPRSRADQLRPVGHVHLHGRRRHHRRPRRGGAPDSLVGRARRRGGRGRGSPRRLQPGAAGLARRHGYLLRTMSVFSVLPTPFDASGEFDADSLRRVIDLFLADGVTGFTALGVTSEVARLTDPERDRVLDAVLTHVASRVPVVAGTTAEGLRTCIEYTRRAKAAG